jgi:hypothetical protein
VATSRQEQSQEIGDPLELMHEPRLRLGTS